MTLYVLTEKKNKITEVLTLQEIKQRHAKTASITGAPPLIEIETEESAEARRKTIKQNDKHHDEHIEAGFEEPFVPKPLPVQEFYTYVRVLDEAPAAEERVVERGEVKFVDGAFRVIYTSRALTIEEQAAKAVKKAEEDAAYKAARALTPLLTAETILLVHQLASAAKLTIPPVVQKFKDEYGG